MDSEAVSTATTIAYQYTTLNFTLAASAIDGIALKVASRTAGATGTVTIILSNVTNAGLREATVTLNVSDFPNLQVYAGWFFFKFASSVTPNGTDAYRIGVLTSVAGTLTFYSSATTNWAHLIRLTANAAGAPVAGDKLMIMGEWTAGSPDSLTNFTVTMDSTAPTSYGPTVSGGPPAGMTINSGGTLAYGNAASTNYQLVVKGIIRVAAGGTLKISGATNGNISYYPFEGDANDWVGSSNGTLNGSPAFAAGIVGQAVVLNGSSQSVTLPVAITNALAIASNWSISLWFKATTTAGTQTILGSATGASNQVYLQIVSGNLTSLRYNGSVYAGFTSAVSAGSWYHAVLASNGITTALYVNGVIVSTTTASGTTSGTNATYLGCDTTGAGQWFNGLIDDVGFYNRVLSPSEITTLYTNATLLTGYWAFENNLAYDLSGNGNNGTLNNSPTFVTGIAGNAISLNGSSQSVSLTDAADLKSANITVSAWYKSTVPVSANAQIILDHQSTTPFYGYQLGVATTGKAFWSVKGTGAMVTVNGTTAMVANQWYHIVGTYDGTTMNLYVNGLNNGTSAASTGNIDYTASVTPCIGRLVGGGSSFVNGQIDELRIYNTALTVSQVGALYVSDRTFPFPSTSSASLQHASVANVDSGLNVYNGGVLAVMGTPLLYDRCMLAADVIATATSVTTSVNTGWSSANVWGTGDTIVLATTSTTYSQNDSRVLTGVSGTTLTVAALTNGHSGTVPYQGEIIHLTRNVLIGGASQLLCGYLYTSASSIVSCQWAEFKWQGSATAAKYGTTFETTTGSLLMNYCSMHDYFATASTSCAFYTNTDNKNSIISNNVIYNMAYMFCYMTANNTTGGISLTNNWAILSAAYGYYVAPYIVFTGNRTIGCGTTAGVTILSNIGVGTSTDLLGTWDSNLVHSCGGYGFYVANAPSKGGSITNTTTWRNGTAGFAMSDGYQLTCSNITSYNNGGGNLWLNYTTNCLITNANLYSGAYGVFLGMNTGTIISNSSFGITATHTTGDIVIPGVARRGSMIFDNCLFGSPTLVSTGGVYLSGSTISFQRFQQVNGSHKTITCAGNISTDTTIYYSLATGSSERLTPSFISIPLDSSRRRTSCAMGNAITFSCYVRTSVFGDGTAYTGNQPQLWLIANPAMGVTADTLLATASNLPGQWQLLSGSTSTGVAGALDDGVFEAVVRVPGSAVTSNCAGWINVANWTVA